ncbi:hypothetical protein GCM10009830_19100 [Glycomyces endophyticus]|uniref:Uncharacterized protein n=1 Tax=Glycomyces endophyticus TaxID=480996 RepID=A0ABP4SHG7_9ACTN
MVARTGPGPWPHPVEIGVQPAGANSVVSFSLGPHAVNSGGRVPLRSVLDGTGLNPLFAAEFDAADLHWLVPHLVRLRDGQADAGDIRAAYEERHGKRPESMD